MIRLSYAKISSTVKDIFSIKEELDVIDKALKISMSDIDSKSRGFLNKALDAQLANIRAEKYLASIDGAELREGEVNEFITPN